MTNDEAKFTLQGYRPNGSDADDPAIAEALAQAERDPALRAWFEREQQFDTAIATGLGNVVVPHGLRDSILAGKKLSNAHRPVLALPWWAGMAAAVALTVGTLAVMQLVKAPPQELASVNSVVDFAWTEMNGAHPRSKHADEYGEVGTWLENPETRLRNGMPLGLQTLIDKGCRSQRIAGALVVEVCFRRNGKIFHVYIAPRDSFHDRGLDTEPTFQQKGEFVTASWADDRFVYVLASKHGSDGLRAIL
ncbi:MAG TPA: hypothetical protein VMM36_07000 [Opitutaceae bacterium]|nr:hypothetical protein [Opitutaceae bacterium]